MKSFHFLSILFAVATFANTTMAQEVRITPEIPFVELFLNDAFVVIERSQDNEAVITPAFAKTSRPCPPFCIHPMSAGPGVETVGEVEVIAFLENNVQANDGFLVDSRTVEFFNAGTIPGSINLPFNLFTPSNENPFLAPLLSRLGGTLQDDGKWDFSASSKLMLFCNGPWCDQSGRAINNLLTLGYPAEKLFYYRGGMQNWLMAGLNIQVP